jgi:hypothetical protein
MNIRFINGAKEQRQHIWWNALAFVIFFPNYIKLSTKFYKEFCKHKVMEFRAQKKDVRISLKNAHGSLQANYKNLDLQ